MASEDDIFAKLSSLCTSPGYIHALAFICFRDNMVGYAGQFSSECLLEKYSWDRLIRTEITTLIGLMVKAPIDYCLPDASTIQEYVDNTYSLLNLLHKSMVDFPSAPDFPIETNAAQSELLNSGKMLREPIFYSGESAYSFQLRDLAVPKYAADNTWLESNKGFSIELARKVILTFTKLQNEKLTNTLYGLRDKLPAEWTLLDGFSLDTQSVSRACNEPPEKVAAVLSAFALEKSENNSSFRSLHDFNVITSTPLVRRDIDSYVLFEQRSLNQALYESPFYWMAADKHYVDLAMENRGTFSEEFVAQRLKAVFGDKDVFRGVQILETKDKTVTDADVLVLFGNRAVVVQLKSKKLTLEARRGNDGCIKADFQMGVQKAYDQGFVAADALIHRQNKIFKTNEGVLQIPDLKEVFIICALSELYPALAFQSNQFLKTKTTDAIRPPIVTDVFAIDAMTEMLDSPLWFISYIHRRSGYSHKLFVPDELTTLSYHLKRNLWLDDEYDLVHLSDDISCELDAAMTVRRENIPGKRTPEGILTKFVGSTIEMILKQVEARPEGAALDFAFTVLTCDEETTYRLSEGVDKILELSRTDGKGHDFSVCIRSDPPTGITIHCNDKPETVARLLLTNHCEKRKYMHRAATWFGISIHPRTKMIRFGISFQYPWKYNSRIESEVHDFLNLKRRRKIGRNDLCPCGSGKKYKKCCLV